jgi:hypothetical protein
LEHQRRLFSFGQAGPTLDQPHLRGFRPRATLGNIEENEISFAEAHQPGLFKARNVHEYVAAAATSTSLRQQV